MAERRMFAKTIIDSDAFLDMPISSQLLYFHLGMRADDDGFINNPRSIMRMLGGSEGDIQNLIDKKFIISFPDGVVCLKHWKIHNYIRKDTYTQTKYKDDMTMLELDENNSYRMRDRSVTEPLQSCEGSRTQVRIGKDRIGKDKDIHIRNIVPPDVEWVKTYCEERKNGIDPQRFCDYYGARGWKLKNGLMKDWQAAVRTWEGNKEPKKDHTNNRYDFKALQDMIDNG